MSGSMKKGGVVLGAVLIAVLASGVAHADHAMEMKAREDFAAGRYDKALDLFAKLYAETLNPVYLRNIGRCHQKMREPQKAIDAFQDYLAKGKKISADERAEIEGYIKEMTALRDEQARQGQAPPVAPVAPVTPVAPQPPPGWTVAPPPGAQPEAPPPAWNPPPPGPGAAPGDSAVLVAQPAPVVEPSRPIYAKWWFWTIIGAVAVGSVVAVVALSSGTTRPDCPTGVVTCR
jgi:hypothetical protein